MSMKPETFCLFLFVLLIQTTSLFAGDDLHIGGYLQTGNRFVLEGSKLTWNENRLNLKLSAGDRIDYSLYSEVQLRKFGHTEEDSSMAYVELSEAYLDLYSFPSKSVDIRLGRQMINWGTADGINPTGNICPDDLEMLLDFGNHLGVDAIKGTYYASSATFECVYVPTFTPARLPPSEYAGALVSAFSSGIDLPPGVSLEGFTQQSEVPDNDLRESSQFAMKLATFARGFDLSLSYYYGRDDLPLPGSISLQDSVIILIYPRLQVIGADFAGSIGSVGFWGEGGLFLPEEVLLEMPGVPPLVIQENTPYTRFVVGNDYTFRNGIYVNAQVFHGFVHERGSENLNDYLAFRVEQDAMGDKLTIVPISVLFSVSDWEDPQENYGVAYVPELRYRPIDNVEMTMNCSILHGEGTNMFSQLGNLDDIFLKVRASF